MAVDLNKAIKIGTDFYFIDFSYCVSFVVGFFYSMNILLNVFLVDSVNYFLDID